MQYQLVTYDVWGNTKDGYEVNAAYTTNHFIELCGNESDGLINRRLNTLTGASAAHPVGVSFKGTTWDGEPGFTFYGTNKANGKPVCELRAVEVRPEPNTEGAEAEAQRLTWQAHIADMRAAGWLVVAWTPEELKGCDDGYLEDAVTSYGNDLIDTTAEEDAAIVAQASFMETEEQLDWVDSDDDFTRGEHDL